MFFSSYSNGLNWTGGFDVLKNPPALKMWLVILNVIMMHAEAT